ncbi:MAG: response regulator [Candidatus Omnitrophica bacterium]|nr:response regulator [Candidatus Omnitrophota bacterium]
MRKILIIDDDQNLTKLIQAHLNKLGYTVLLAHTSEDGIKLAKKNKPDLILMDVMMPGTDGAESVKLLKADPIVSDIPVIFLTALISTDGENEQQEKVLVDDIYYETIGKPFELNDLIERINNKLPG